MASSGSTGVSSRIAGSHGLLGNGRSPSATARNSEGSCARPDHGLRGRPCLALGRPGGQERCGLRPDPTHGRELGGAGGHNFRLGPPLPSTGGGPVAGVSGEEPRGTPTRRPGPGPLGASLGGYRAGGWHRPGRLGTRWSGRRGFLSGPGPPAAGLLSPGGGHGIPNPTASLL